MQSFAMSRFKMCLFFCEKPFWQTQMAALKINLAKIIACLSSIWRKQPHFKIKLGKLWHILKLYLAKKHARVEAKLGKLLHMLKLNLAKNCTP